MKLSDKNIEKWLDLKKIIINPRPSKNRINGITVDIKLGNKFITFKKEKKCFFNLHNKKENVFNNFQYLMNEEIVLSQKEYFLLKPGELALSITHEHLTLPNNLVGWIDGKSSLARLGLMIHVTSHRIDPGWKGHLVLECFNAGKLQLMLQPEMLICAISFELIYGKVIRPYNNRKNSKYNNQNNIFISKIGQD